jgi:hypothetical protein
MPLAPLNLIRAATAAGLVSALAPTVPAQDAKTDPRPATFRADTALVVLDLVVRDKKGQPVRDLRPEEVQVYEDGVRRDIAAFRLVETGAPPSPPTGPRPRPHLRLRP